MSLLNDEKFKSLSELVKEAWILDKKTFKALETATSEWKAANKILTERNKLLSDYVAYQINEHTICDNEIN